MDAPPAVSIHAVLIPLCPALGHQSHQVLVHRRDRLLDTVGIEQDAMRYFCLTLSNGATILITVFNFERLYTSPVHLIQRLELNHKPQQTEPSGRQVRRTTMQFHLGQLAVGDKAVVSGFAEGKKEYRAKLLAMGLTKGIALELTRVAPLGDPLEISVRGFSLSLRKAEAAAVLVERS
jgi:ferrous iron transport protein A